MPIAGGEPVRLPMKPDLNSWQPRWSPDGQWIAFESERDVPGDRKLDENIFIVSSEGGEPRQLTNHTDSFCELEAWSPGGDSIAYACSDKTIRIIPVDGGEPRVVLKVDGFGVPFGLARLDARRLPAHLQRQRPALDGLRCRRRAHGDHHRP